MYLGTDILPRLEKNNLALDAIVIVTLSTRAELNTADMTAMVCAEPRPCTWPSAVRLGLPRLPG